MERTITFFTHIPKTSGTTFFRSSVQPNFKHGQIYGACSLSENVTNWAKGQLKDENIKFVTGHFRYGVHHLFQCKPIYIAFLRDPVDRAVSFYYFIKSSDVNLYKHPLRDYADSVSIEDFYKNPKFSNMICQYIAGYADSYLYQNLGSMTGIRNRLLVAAKKNLFDNYLCYGMLEHFDESRDLICTRLSLKDVKREVENQKKTARRPNLQELSDRTLAALKSANALDVELYDIAKERFFTQMEPDSFNSLNAQR